MRLDHLAFRTRDRWKTTNFYIEVFGYKVQEEFRPYDDDSVLCVALQPYERKVLGHPFSMLGPVTAHGFNGGGLIYPPPGPSTYHLPPEIFVSDGKPGSVVHEWVEKYGPGVHHMAYLVDNVARETQRWKDNGWGNFLSEDPLSCPGIEQIFSEPVEVVGNIIFEFISRGDRGFCKESIRGLMDSTKDL